MLGSVFSANEYGHLSLPRSLYILTPAVVIGYFGYEAMASLLARWREDYAAEQALPRVRVFAVELFQLLRERMWWWLAPMSFVALTVAGIVIFQQGSAATPFMYTLF
jgi:cytochrome b subunit of formate dehydrogenase